MFYITCVICKYLEHKTVPISWVGSVYYFTDYVTCVGINRRTKDDGDIHKYDKQVKQYKFKFAKVKLLIFPPLRM